MRKHLCNAAAIIEECLLTWLGSPYYFSALMSCRFMYTHMVQCYVSFWHADVFFPFKFRVWMRFVLDGKDTVRMHLFVFVYFICVYVILPVRY